MPPHPAHGRRPFTCELAGSIASAAFTSGHRFVVGIWEHSPVGPMADVMWAPPGGERVLLVAREEEGAFISAVYRFDRVEVVALECHFESSRHGPTLRVSAGELELTLRCGRNWRIPLAGLRSQAAFRRVEAVVARRLLQRAASPAVGGAGAAAARRPDRGSGPDRAGAYLTGPRRSTGDTQTIPERPVTTTVPQPAVDVRRADDRFATDIGWLGSRHSFSFGPHYRADNTHFGLLLVNNDDRVQAGTGFETHPHRDMEIVTWVLQGSLVHQDSEGHTGVLYPGLAQRMSAGTGIRHSEKNDSWRLHGGPAHDEPVHFVQMWVPPDEAGIRPGYEQLEIDDVLLRGGLVPVASGMASHDGVSAIRIKNRYAALHAARLHRGDGVELPDAPFTHVFVARGGVELEGVGRLDEGDAARITDTGGRAVTASEPAEILVWEMHATIG